MMTATVVLMAHAGHWLAGLAFASPAIIIPLGLLATAMADRRRDRQ